MVDFKFGVIVVLIIKLILGWVCFCKFKIEDNLFFLRCLLKINKIDR